MYKLPMLVGPISLARKSIFMHVASSPDLVPEGRLWGPQAPASARWIKVINANFVNIAYKSTVRLLIKYLSSWNDWI